MQDKLFKRNSTIRGEPSVHDEGNDDAVVSETDALVEEQETWSSGKQLELYTTNEDEVIIALTNGGVKKKVDFGQSKPKKGKGKEKILGKNVTP